MSIRFMIKNVWSFREFIFASVKREFNVRYRNTQFGFIWIIMQPLSMIFIYTVIFSKIMRPSLPGHASRFAYSIYLCSGILIWSLFSDILNRSISVFVNNAHLLKKINFPKLCLPIALIIASIIDFIIVMGIFILFLLVTGNLPGLVIWATIPIVGIVVTFSVGLGIFLGTINVFYRDVEKTMSIVLDFWFWLTPIVYAVKTLPPVATLVLKWNPLWPIVQAMHKIFLEFSFPTWPDLLYPIILSIFFVFLGIFSFWRLNVEIVDEL